MTNYLNILHNNKAIENANEFELFPKKYDDEFKAATYSISPSFLKNLSHFNTIDLIVGIKNDDYQSKTINKIYYQENLKNIIENTSLDFLNSLNNETKEKISNKKINIYSPIYPIHTKLFLMSNKFGSENRIIIGSANLTNTALNVNIPQFEDIVVIDNNNDLFNFYLKRFEELKKHTHTFIPDLILKKLNDNLKKFKKTKKDLKETNNINVIVLNNDIQNKDFEINANELNKIEKTVFIENNSNQIFLNNNNENETNKFYNQFESKNIVDENQENFEIDKEIIDLSYISLNQEEKENIIIDALSGLNNSIDNAVENQILPKETLELLKDEALNSIKNSNKNKVEFEKIYRLTKDLIVKSTSAKKKNKFEESKPKLSKIIRETINIQVIEMEKENHLTRLHLTRLDNQVTDTSVAGNVISIKDDKVNKYSSFATDEQIKSSIQSIDKMISGYQNYLTKYTDDIGKKIFEVLLYSFTSPFMSMIRKSALTNEDRQHIPIFMFVGGIGGSGKSSLLRCISKMMNDDYEIKAFIDYDRISLHKTASVKTTETVATIKDLLSENNVFPLMVDEIPAKFFENSSVGEHIIVHTSNTIDETTMEYPAFIGTTNCSNYSMDERATRRSYYIQLDIPFKDDKRVELSAHYQEILNSLNTDLFKDFLARFHQVTLDKSIEFVKSDNFGMLDFMVISREIFKEYYKIAGIKLPSYFNKERLNDYKINGKEKWLSLFKSEFKNKTIFNYNKHEDILYFIPSSLDVNQKTHQSRRAETYLKALPNSISNANENSYNIAISGKDFFNWLKIKNPYVSFWNKNKITNT